MSPEALTSAAAHWERLAAEALDMARWNREHGLDLSMPGHSAGDYQAATFRRTAEALRRQAATGRVHCSACGGDHANHEHPSLPSSGGCRPKREAIFEPADELEEAIILIAEASTPSETPGVVSDDLAEQIIMLCR